MLKDDILTFLKANKANLQKAGIEKVGLFGSFARGDFGENSDIDIVVLADKERFLGRLGDFGASVFLDEFRAKVSEKFQKNVDILDFYSAEKLAQNNIVKGAIYA